MDLDLRGWMMDGWLFSHTILLDLFFSFIASGFSVTVGL
jgi:hypothetical protein